jgi:hypothetical protein
LELHNQLFRRIIIHEGGIIMQNMLSQILGIINQINQIQNAWEVMTLLVISVSSIVAFGVWLVFFYRKESRLFRNLKRKVYFFRLKNSTCDLEKERYLVDTNGFFTADNAVREFSQTIHDTVVGPAVVVMAYSSKFTGYQQFLESALAKKVPVLIFAKPSEINPKHNVLFAEYPYLQVCNYGSRLLTSLFDICAITPYDQK